MTPRAALFDKSETAVRISLCASHRLPAVVRHFLPSEKFSIAIVVNPQYLILSLLKASPTAGTVVVSAQ